METDNIVYQQRQWILEDYNSIVEEPDLMVMIAYTDIWTK